MSQLLRRPQTPTAEGLVHRVTPANAGWQHVGFDLYRLAPGQRLAQATGEREACLVLIGGRADVTADGQNWRGIGEREGPFEGPKPYAVYVPAGGQYEVVAQSPLELAVCTAPGGGQHQARLIGPDQVTSTARGQGTNTRHVQDILPDSASAHSLLVVEVITPGGNWSSYPSHKHDVDNLPEESLLEETYYHRINPPLGFAFQRVYSDDRTLDETMTVHDGDVVLVPRGYHPVGAAHGYDLYYLNVMAGPKRVWRFNTEPAHRWLLG